MFIRITATNASHVGVVGYKDFEKVLGRWKGNKSKRVKEKDEGRTWIEKRRKSVTQECYAYRNGCRKSD